MINRKGEGGDWFRPSKLAAKSSMNKKGEGGDWFALGGFLLILVVIAGGTAGAYISFFSNDFDYRPVEARMLFSEVNECFDRHGPFSTVEEIAEKCKMNSNVLESDHLVYFRNLESGEEVFIGVRDFMTQCGLGELTDEAPVCQRTEKEGYEIIVGSNQQGRMVVG